MAGKSSSTTRNTDPTHRTFQAKFCAKVKIAESTRKLPRHSQKNHRTTGQEVREMPPERTRHKFADGEIRHKWDRLTHSHAGTDPATEKPTGTVGLSICVSGKPSLPRRYRRPGESVNRRRIGIGSALRRLPHCIATASARPRKPDPALGATLFSKSQPAPAQTAPRTGILLRRRTRAGAGTSRKGFRTTRPPPARWRASGRGAPDRPAPAVLFAILGPVAQRNRSMILNSAGSARPACLGP